MAIASITPPTPASARAADAASASWRMSWSARRNAFFQILNWHTVALTFYVALVLVLTSYLPLIIIAPNSDTFFTIAYMVRQVLASALCVLLAIALAEALVPRSVAPRWRWFWAVLLIAGAALLSAQIRFAMARNLMSTPAEWQRWMVYVVVLWTLLGTLAYCVIGASRRAAAAHAALLDARCEHDALSASALEARLSALQAQIEPHFLFNTLANVRRLYETDRARGRQMLASLIDYLRAALPSMRQTGTTLARELDLARSYLTVLQLRMGERLRFAIDIGDAPADAALPPMVLPTLVENAIKHGLSPLPEGGRIEVRAHATDGSLVVAVADTGRGFVGAAGSGVGLANTRSRLAALYGERARLTLRNNVPRGVVAEVVVPLTRTVEAPA
jgi:two-component sensor histidine kinase